MRSPNANPPEHRPRAGRGRAPRSRRRMGARLALVLAAAVAALAMVAPGASAAEVPWTCSAYGYLFQDPAVTPPGSIYQVDLASGAYTNYGTTADNVNAVGYNILDNYVYGYDQTAGELVRVSSDGSLTPLGLPAGVNPALPYNVGDVDSAGHYWMMDGNSVPPQWYEIDLAPGSPTYGDVLDSGTAALPAGVTVIADWAFINGALYSVTTTASGPAALVKFDTTTGQFGDLGPIAGVPGTNFYGAVYTDAAGDLFASNNTTGVIYRVNVSNGTGIAVSEGPASGNNDGERCATAPIPTVTVTKAVEGGRGRSTDQFTVGLSDSAGKSLTTATTSGAGTTASTTNWPVSQGSTYTITDAMASGSASRIGEYVQSVKCTDSAGNTVPTGGTSGSWTLNIASATEYTCKVTNASSADLQAGKSAEPATAVPGESETFTLSVKNKGPSPAREATVSDPLPAGVTFVSADTGCNLAGGTVTCAAGTLDPGASKSFKVVTKVVGSLDHAIENTATVHSPTPDPEPGNNEEKIVVPIKGKADLSLTKTPAAKTVKVGGQIMYTLVVKNSGPSDATGVKVEDPTPKGLTLVSAQPSQGTCSTVGGDVSCDLGKLVSGGSAQVLVTTTAGQATGSIVNRAKVHADQEDPEPKNNEATGTVEVTPGPAPTFELEVVKTADTTTPTIGQKMTFTIAVKNNGPDPAPNAQMTDTPNTPMKVVSVKPETGTCNATAPIHCELGTIQSGQTVKITVVAKPQEVGKGKRNVAGVTGEGNDTEPNNNLDVLRFNVKKVKLKLTKVASKSSVHPGEAFSYLIKVKNLTKGIAKKVQVCDRLPSGLAYLSSAPKGKLSKGKLCWNAGTLGPKATRKFTVVVKALAAGGTKVNRAVATGPQVAAAKAKSAVRVTAPAPKPTPVTG
jgi:uncharacterized repeat protein (TIGR01451 family)